MDKEREREEIEDEEKEIDNLLKGSEVLKKKPVEKKAKNKNGNLMQEKQKEISGNVISQNFEGRSDKSKLEEDTGETSEKQNKQILWAFILMISMILIIIFVPIIKANFFDKFEYIGIDFQKTKLGELTFYSIKVPIADITGRTVVGEYALNFRKDPRELEYIPIDIPNNKVIFVKDEEKPVFITINPKMEACEDNTIALMNLAGFLRDFAGFNVSSAVTNKTYAYKEGYFFRDCFNSYGSTIIQINSGNKTEIKKIGMRCYELTYSDCEILEVTEKFMMIVLEDYISYFKKK